MVIITGLGRCGTSILTKYLGEVGFKLGKQVSWNPQMRAGLELAPAYSINRNIFLRYLNHKKDDIFFRKVNIDDDSPGDYWKGTIREAMVGVDKDQRQGKVDVIKDPRFTWHPYLIEAWWEARQDFSLIICHRTPEDIYKSRKSMEPHQDDPKRKELNEYKVDFTDFYTAVLRLGIPHRVLFFPKFLFEFERTWVALDEMGLGHPYNKGKEVWDNLIELDKYVK